MHFHLPPPPLKKRKLEEDHVERFYDPYTLESPNGDVSITFHPNETVQLIDKSLLTIHHFEQDVQLDNDELVINIFVVGRRYLRFRDCEELGGFLRNDSREVYQVGNGKGTVIGPDRPRYSVHQIRRRVNLIKTNLSHGDFQSPSRDTFVCRYAYDENAIVRLSAKDADQGGTRVDDTRRRNMFVYRRANVPPPAGSKRYTFGDGFCGVGGTSAGARNAGLEVRWAFDGNFDTCAIYAENFHRSNVFAGSVDQFLALAEDSHVDVLHLSPPCQPFSVAHTRPGIMDDANSAALFCVLELLSTVRPRIATIEEVPQFIRSEDNKLFFQSLLRQILDAEYSVKWKVLRAEEYGVPQCRERVVFILSCPGQPPPDFPPATYGPGRQAPYVTVRQAIQGISPHDRLHIPRPFTAFPLDGRYIDLDKPFIGTIMAGSNPYLHAEERRPFTHRESARVQTFGDAHVLGEVYVQRQIGNAVPVLLAQRVFESVVTTLRVTDGQARDNRSIV